MTPIRILIADDHPMFRFGIRALLSAETDMDVVGEATNGQEAVNLATSLKPDLILMDISLPVMDGYEATRQIREKLQSTPIIGLSAHAMAGHELKAKEAGCNDYLTKPINDQLLFDKLKQYLGE